MVVIIATIDAHALRTFHSMCLVNVNKLSDVSHTAIHHSWFRDPGCNFCSAMIMSLMQPECPKLDAVWKQLAVPPS